MKDSENAGFYTKLLFSEGEFPDTVGRTVKSLSDVKASTESRLLGQISCMAQGDSR